MKNGLYDMVEIIYEESIRDGICIKISFKNDGLWYDKYVYHTDGILIYSNNEYGKNLSYVYDFLEKMGISNNNMKIIHNNNSDIKHYRLYCNI